MNYPQTIQYLNSFINYEKKNNFSYTQSFRLERVKKLLNLLNNPQDYLKCIHVAGTKGKGSTCAFTAYILKEAGYRVGLYTSPHLSDFRERIRILGSLTIGHRLSAGDDFEGMITPRELIRLVERLKAKIEKYSHIFKLERLSFFEVYTVLAFMYFKQKKVDFAVLETGLGGRLDATNVVNSYACGITSLSYEHTRILGKTLREIAREKVGIIKSRQTIVVTAPQKRQALEMIRNRCHRVGARLYEVNKDLCFKKAQNGFNIKGLYRKYPRLKIRLLGEHQLINATLAVGLIEALRPHGLKLNIDCIRRGLYNTVWPGRCEVISRDPLVVLDGAQNVASAEALKKTILGNFKYQKLILVLGISRDKDIKGICKKLQGLANEIILTKADNPRASKPRILARCFKGKSVLLTNTVKEAIVKARVLAGQKDLILVTGSLFVVGEARSLF